MARAKPTPETPSAPDERAERRAALLASLDAAKARDRAATTELGIERRFVPLQNCEIRDAGDGSPPVFFGYFAKFNELSVDLGGFRERINPACFDDSLDEGDVRVLKNHDANLILGRTTAGTATIGKDESGSFVECPLPATSYAQDLRVNVERGDITGMSFGFNDPLAEWNDFDAETGLPIRDLMSAGLIDVGPVTFPAYPTTTAEIRALSETPEEVRRYAKQLTDERAAAEAESEADVPADPEPKTETRDTRDRQTRDFDPRLALRYTRISQVISETPWAMLPEMLTLFLTIVGERASGHDIPDEEITRRIALHKVEERESTPTDIPSVAVLSVQGPIYPRAGLIKNASEEAVALQEFQGEFRAAVHDPSVKAIVLNIDSPGGSVDLVQEVADEIRAARDTKTIVAVANTMAASAAYWIASACSELVVTPSGEVGSIGVWAAHQNISSALQQEGVEMTLISAGRYKVEGNPFEPLSDEARAQIQSSVDSYHDMFVAGVAKGRGVPRDVVRSDFGQGRMLNAKKALAAGMVDRIETLDETIARLSRGARSVADLGDDAFETRESLRSALGFEFRNAPASYADEFERERFRLDLIDRS